MAVSLLIQLLQKEAYQIFAKSNVEIQNVNCCFSSPFNPKSSQNFTVRRVSNFVFLKILQKFLSSRSCKKLAIFKK